LLTIGGFWREAAVDSQAVSVTDKGVSRHLIATLRMDMAVRDTAIQFGRN
jgi:hypothetical protein